MARDFSTLITGRKQKSNDPNNDNPVLGLFHHIRPECATSLMALAKEQSSHMHKDFEKALEIIKIKFPDQIEIITTESIPYNQYINLYNKAHILLDQCYAHDQGYNALEAMAKGKVVFTGAEKEFLEHYNLQEDEVAINAKPDVDYLVEKLSMLIENPEKIIQISKNARAFIEKEHNYVRIAEKYLEVWKS